LLKKTLKRHFTKTMTEIREKSKLRNRKKTHRLLLTFNMKFNPKDSLNKHTLSIKYSYGTSFKRFKSSGFEVLHSEWDKKAETIKNPEKHKELSKWIGEYKKKQEDCRFRIASGEINYEEAFDVLLGKTTTGLILDSIEQNGQKKKKSKATIKKASDYIKAVQSGMMRLKQYDYSELDYEHLSNESDIRKIESLILKEMTWLKNNTKNDYLKYLNYGYQWNPDTKGKPFKETVKADEQVPKIPIPKVVLIEAINNIGDNSQWFEAYLFCLLSFSLRGLNGADICCLNQEWIKDESGRPVKDFKHYLPDYHKLIDTKGKTFLNKQYIVGKRTKSNVGIKILFNQFPTLLLLKLLKRMVAHNRPEYAYKGTDKVRIYSINYYTDKGKQQWKDLLNTYTKQLKKITGGYKISQARNTFTDIMRNHLKVEGDMLSVSLGHRTSKKMYNAYSSVSQEELDIYHIEVLRVFGINGIIQNLHEAHNDKKLSVITDFITGEAKGGISWFNTIEAKELEALELPLSNWDFRDEIKYNHLMNEVSLSASGTFNEKTGKIEILSMEDSYPKELKDLIAKKDSILRERSKWLKGDIQINYNTETNAVEYIDKTDNSKVVKLGKKDKKTKKIANVNKNVS
jgi:hypothetical protein